MKETIKHTYYYAYRKLPPRFRFGKLFWDTYNFLQKSQWWSKEQLQEYQFNELKKIIHHAYKNVPYYTDLFNKHDIRPDRIKDLNDFKKLPYLTKDLVNKNKEQLVNKNIAKTRLKSTTTSGTSGKTMHFYRDPDENRPREKAMVWRMWQMFGYTWNDKSVIIKGNLKYVSQKNIYNPANQSLGIYNPVFNQTNFQIHLDTIQKFKPVVIRGYPSLIYSLAHKMISNDVTVNWPWLRFIYCHSEKLFQSQIKTIETAFNTKVRYQYGHTERCVFMQPCESNDDYHIIPEYGVTEFLSSDNNSEMAEIVGTGFFNYAFPLIRYRTNDWTSLPHADSCQCGRHFKLVRDILGRAGDFIVTPSGGLVSPTILEMGREFTSNYLDILIVQLDERNLEVQIVPDTRYNDSDGTALKKFIEERVGEPVNIEVKLLDEIPRSDNNKKRFVKSEIANAYLNNNNQETV